MNRANGGGKVFHIANEDRLHPGVVVVDWHHGSKRNDSPGHGGRCQPGWLNPTGDLRWRLCRMLAALGRRGPAMRGGTASLEFYHNPDGEHR